MTDNAQGERRESEMVETAISIAVNAHAGQKDKAGRPYILHPLRVMSRMDTDDERAAAVLHDVLEDCPDWSCKALLAEGIPMSVLDALICLTRLPNETYPQFIRRCSLNAISTKVKIADLRDNLDLTRLHTVSEADIARHAKYRRALRDLLDLANSRGRDG